EEHATRELLIIASGLSIQDPRERPLEKRAQADAAHRRFVHPGSDFLTLLNLWNAVHDEWEALRTQGQRRRFCHAHFLSYLRLREWQDLYAQLHGALEELGTVNLNESNAAETAVHRSILSGLLAHVAQRAERNTYQGTGNRALQVFPGSVLFERAEPVSKGRDPARRAKESQGSGESRTRQPPWIVAGEIVETSQRFARTLAGIEPEWIVELAPHLCRTTHQGPHWSVTSGRVLVDEVVTFQGLEVRRRKVAFGNLQPAEATALFIRSALVEENLLPTRPAEDGSDEPEESLSDLPPQYAFLAHNRKIRQTVESWQTRVRRRDLGDPDEALHRFYAARLEGVSSIAELNRVLRERQDPGFLCATVADLSGGRDLAFDHAAFPETITVGGHPVPLTYAYAPGEEWDGVTLRLPAELLGEVAPAALEWSVPGLRSELAAEWLASLPKALRRELQPFPPKVEAIVRELQPASGALCDELGRWLHRHCGVRVPAESWRAESVPAHLRPRIEILGGDGRVLGAGRDPAELRARVSAAPIRASGESPAWKRFAQSWERVGVTGWTFGDLPESVSSGGAGAADLTGHPGLICEDGAVHVRLFRTAAAARAASREGFRRLVELALHKDLAWAEKDLRALDRLHLECGSPASSEILRETALNHLRTAVLPETAPVPLTRAGFDAAVAAAREQLRGAPARLVDSLKGILEARKTLLQRLGASAGAPAPAKTRTLNDLSQLALPGAPQPVRPGQGQASRPGVAAVVKELETLLPPRFLEQTPGSRLAHFPRYLKALQLRLERAATNPAKDAERSRLLAPYEDALRRLRESPPASAEAQRLRDEFRWMLEEYKVSLFAQELGTATPVSPKRLDALLES
ncbi:MAG: DUF3418 domain-containing protein, partial [Verrucomicrobiae bacterium]|nr:DUF3418 domain-containing protein [Verrucomicrobiae bacterium]